MGLPLSVVFLGLILSVYKVMSWRTTDRPEVQPIAFLFSDGKWIILNWAVSMIFDLINDAKNHVYKNFALTECCSLVTSALFNAVVKNLPANAGETRDMVLIPEWGRSPGEVNGNSLQYSCLENSMDRGAWWAIVHRVAKSDWTCTHMNYLQNILNVHKVQFLSYPSAKVYKQKLQYFLSKLLRSFYSLLPPCPQLEYSLRVHSSCQREVSLIILEQLWQEQTYQALREWDYLINTTSSGKKGVSIGRYWSCDLSSFSQTSLKVWWIKS